jgi:hypothetical protein
MATGACEKSNLLNVFRDNNTQAITAASMRLMVDCVYENFIEVNKIIDNLQTYDSTLVLSANQGAILNDLIEVNEQLIQDLDANKVNTGDVYTKAESDNLYYNKSEIDANVYTKAEVYNKIEIDQMLDAIQNSINDLNARIDNIVIKNNLVE